jgi:hypothetical protein
MRKILTAALITAFASATYPGPLVLQGKGTIPR